MTRRLLLALTLAALPIVASAAGQKSPAPPPITVDTHVDTPTEYMNKPFDLGVANKDGHFDFARMKAGGVDAVFLVAYVPAKYADKGAAAFCLKIMETVRTMVDSVPDKAAFVTSTAGMRKAQKDGKRAVLIGIEGGHAIEDSLDILRSFYRLGARYMTLTHTNTNHWADSSGDKPAHDGLTDFGRDVVREMNRLGMMVDVSHVADATFWDVIETTRAPVIASHSSARALAEHNRNMNDDMLRAVAKNGGVVMVNFYPVFISAEVGAASRARDARLKPQMDALDAKYPGEGPEYDAAVKALRDADPLPKASYTVVADHIEHIAKVAGVDHVGIGSDFDGIDEVPAGLEDISRMATLRTELKRRGFSEADLRKIMGENLMRVFAAVEKVAADSH
jgi:membrane dipeptidase